MSALPFALQFDIDGQEKDADFALRHLAFAELLIDGRRVDAGDQHMVVVDPVQCVWRVDGQFTKATALLEGIIV